MFESKSKSSSASSSSSAIPDYTKKLQMRLVDARDRQNVYKLCKNKVRTDELKVGNVIVVANKWAHVIEKVTVNHSGHEVPFPTRQYDYIERFDDGTWWGRSGRYYVSGGIKDTVELFCDP